MIGQDIVNYYLNNPPFENTNSAKYIEFLQFQSNLSLMELSENDPIISESSIPAIVSDDEYVRFDLKSISEQFYKLILLEPEDSIYSDLTDATIVYSRLGMTNFGTITSNAVNAAMKSNSIISLLAINDYLPIIQEWFGTKKEYMIYDNSFVKILSNTPYYTLYKRYKDINELKASELRTFKRLLGINVMLDIYQSDIFASEGGIRSVSLSGLSVSFNVPEATSKIASLERQKRDLLNAISLDYSDGCVGLI